MRKIVIIVACLVIVIAIVFCLIKVKEKKEFISKVENLIYFQVFILPEYEDSTEEIKKQIEEIKCVEHTEFNSKEEAFKQMQKAFKPELLEGIGSDAFPCSYTVYCHIDELENTYFEEIEKKLESIEGVKQIRSNYRSVLTIYNNSGKETLEKIIDNPDFVLEYIDITDYVTPHS